MLDRFFRNLQEIPVTLGLITIHCILYGLLWARDPGFGALLVNVTGNETLTQFGAQSSPLVWQGQYYRLFFCAFLHGSLLHLILNNIALYVLGRLLERLFGSMGFTVIYVVSLFAGSLASLLWTPPIAISVGASGAIMGLAGGLTVFLLFDMEGRFLITTPSSKLMFFALIAFNLLIGEWVEMINGQAHWGGFLAGCAVGVFFWSRIPGVSLSRSLGTLVFVGCLAGLGGMTYYGLNPQDGPMWHFYKGFRAFERGDADAAEQHLARAAKQGAGNWVVRQLGEVYIQTKQWKKAAKLYNARVKQRPKELGNWLQLVTALSELRRFDQADSALEKAKKRFSREFAHEGIRALFYAARQQERKAIELYQELLEREPYHANFNNNLAWLLVTAKQKKFRNPKLAYQHARIAVKRSQQRVSSYLDTLATVLFALKQTKEAVVTSHKAMQAPDASMHMLHLTAQLKRFQTTLKREEKHKKQRKGAKKQRKGTRAAKPQPRKGVQKRPVHRRLAPVPGARKAAARPVRRPETTPSLRTKPLPRLEPARRATRPTPPRP